MSIDLVFKIANFIATLQWLILGISVFYSNELIKNFTYKFYIPIVLSLLYFFYILTNFRKSKGSFMSLDGIAKLFKNKGILLAGWIHYLAFDLFVGIWILKESLISGINPILTLLSLFFTLIFGPIGFLIHLISKGFY